jgi:hypothetical protein
MVAYLLRGLPVKNRINWRTCAHAPCSFEMCSTEQRSQVCFQREPVKVVANGVTPNVYLLGG